MNAPGTSATSTSSNSIPTGTFPASRTFASQTGKAWSVGQFVIVSSTASPSNYMIGQITSYNSSTGDLTVSVSSSTNTGGSGTFSNWTISLTVLANVAGAATLGANNIFTGTNTWNANSSFNGTIQFNDLAKVYKPSGNSLLTVRNDSAVSSNWSTVKLSTSTSDYEIRTEASVDSFQIVNTTNGKFLFDYNTSSGTCTIEKPLRTTDASSPNELPRLSQVKSLVNKPVKSAVGALDIDLSLGTFFTKTITGASTLTVSNVATAGLVNNFVLELTNAGSNVTFGFAPKWQNGVLPSLTTSGRDVLFFYSHDAGTTWTGVLLARDVK